MTREKFVSSLDSFAVSANSIEIVTPRLSLRIDDNFKEVSYNPNKNELRISYNDDMTLIKSKLASTIKVIKDPCYTRYDLNENISIVIYD